MATFTNNYKRPSTHTKEGQRLLKRQYKYGELWTPIYRGYIVKDLFYMLRIYIFFTVNE